MRIKEYCNYYGENMYIHMLLVFLGILLGLSIAYLYYFNRAQRKKPNEEAKAVYEKRTEEPFFGTGDEIIAVRKCGTSELSFPEEEGRINQNTVDEDSHENLISNQEETLAHAVIPPRSILIVYIAARPNRQFAGYELLQSLLAAGMRHGEMNIFHRYQELAGNGQVLFSLASATEPGTFDIHKMGGFVCKGLTLFMRCGADGDENVERFILLLNTARQLADDLAGDLLDEQRRPLTLDLIEKYKASCQLASTVV